MDRDRAVCPEDEEAYIPSAPYDEVLHCVRSYDGVLSVASEDDGCTSGPKRG